MVTCTFDGTLVPSRQIVREKIVGSGGGYEYEAEVLCRTNLHSDYTALAAKTGLVSKARLLSRKMHIQAQGAVCGTLVLNGISYTNCYIESLSAAEVPQSNLGVWEFTISFVRHTV
ncbi:MAG: hypothetical protein M0Q92_02820 [Methanoregula sp.]|jgi:hypothetical protein|nr:hypothetical protein [Methanoregula sp.]